MEKTHILMVALLSSTISFSSAFALPQSLPLPSAESPLATCPDQPSLSAATENLAKNASLALLAADKDQFQLSMTYIAAMEKELDRMMESKPIISTAEQMRMVRIEYRKGKAKHVILMPFNETKGFEWMSALPGTTPKENEIVTMHIVMDYSKIKQGIEQAWLQATTKDAAKLTAALQDILFNMGNVEIITNPNYLRETYNDMLLTDSFLREELYDYAAISLQHVKKDLNSYSKTVQDKKHSQELNALKLSVDVLSEQLRQKKVSVLKKTTEQTKEWLKLVKQCLSQQ